MVRKLKALEQEKIAKNLIEKNILEMCVVHRKCLLDKNDESFSRDILDSFWNAIEYGLKGGKRLRGILVFASAIAASKKSFKDLSNQEHKCLVDAATAIECVHAFSLVHDDLRIPNMDIRLSFFLCTLLCDTVLPPAFAVAVFPFPVCFRGLELHLGECEWETQPVGVCVFCGNGCD